MGSVFKRDEVWVVKWQDGSGRWRQQRTTCATKAEAKLFVRDLEMKSERQRAGLEALPTDSGIRTFGELLDWWQREYGQRLRSQTVLQFLGKHLTPTLGALPVVDVTPGRIEALLNSKADALSPRSLNHLRGVVHRVFAKAIKRGFWSGPNPAAAVERRRVPKTIPEYLRLDEVPAMLRWLEPHRRPLYACAVWTGMRKGELLGLRKPDVDLEEGTITVRRSYDADTTKGGYADVLPIADELRPFLVAAIQSSPSELVFPAPNGSMQSPEVDVYRILRTALGRAGIVVGYLHKCRRKGCGYEKREAHANCGRCPKCSMRLWAKAIPRHVKFHSLRHTTATLLLKAGVPIATVQRLLRHSDPRLTTEIYGHLDVEDMRAGVNRLRFQNLPHGAPVVRNAHPRQNEAPGALDFSKNSGGFYWSGRLDLNQRPLGPEPSALPG